MKIAIFIILYIVGVISTGVYYYKSLKTSTNRVEETVLMIIALISLFFPITYLLGWLMIIIKKIGDELCKDQ